MGFADKNLMAGEQILYRAHLHWLGFLTAMLATGGGLLYWIVLSIIRSINEGSSDESILSTGWLMTPTYLCFAFAGIQAIGHWIERQTSEFVVTSRRVLIKTGLIRRDSMEMLLEKIENISVNQGIIARMISAGVIVFTGTGGSNQVFDRISNPLEFRRRVQEAIANRHQPQAK